MMSTSPSFWDVLLAQSPQIMGALSQNMGDPQLQFAQNQSNNFSKFQRSQNGRNASSLITNGTGEQTPRQSQPANMTTQPTKATPPTQMNTGPSRTVMGGLNRPMPFGGTNFDSMPGSLSYQGPNYGNSGIGGKIGTNLWNNYNRMTNMFPNGNNLIY